MPTHRPKGKYLKSRPYRGKCEKCEIETKEVYQRIDGNNYLITYNALYLCRDCYEKEYGKEIVIRPTVNYER